MNLLVYILLYPLIWGVSILPFRILYGVSNGIFFIIYYLFDYRKKVVAHNLKLVFPQKSTTELKRIHKKFYRHFVDIFMEMIKSFSISKKEMDKHYKYTNAHVLNNLYKDGKSVILVGAHFANWEWILGISGFVKYDCFAAYNKLNNPYFNKRILKSRGKFGVNLVKTTNTIPTLIKNQKDKKQALYGLLSDQSPQLKKTFYWQKFLGIKVPVHTGAEMLAKKYDMNLVFMETKKVKRGYYETTFSLITTEAKKYPNYALTDLFLEKAEKQIRNKPEHYFWTHNRFKHKDKAPITK